MSRQSAYDQSQEFLLSAYKSLSEEKQEHAQTCHECNGSGFDPLTPPDHWFNPSLPADKIKICPTCKGSTSVIVMR